MEIVWVISVILLGAFVQGLTGFGLALVSVPLLSLLIDVKTAIPLAGIFGWLITFPLVYKMRQHVQWRAALFMVVASLPGSLLGADLLKEVPEKWILVAMGVVLIAAALHALRRKAKPVTPHKKSPWLAACAGFSSGILGASVGEPGPPAIAYTAMQAWTSDQAKASLLFFFMLQMVGAIFGFWDRGLLNDDVFRLFSWGVPSFLVGLLLGIKAWDLLKTSKIDYHHAVHIFLLGIGAFLLIKNLFFYPS